MSNQLVDSCLLVNRRVEKLQEQSFTCTEITQSGRSVRNNGKNHFVPLLDQSKPIQQSHDVSMQKVKLQSMPTKADGNCFFHAVFGNDSVGQYSAPKADNMRQEWHNFLSQFKSLQDQAMPTPLKEQLQKIFNLFLKRTDDLTSRSQEIKTLADETKKRIKDANIKVKKLKDDIADKFQDKDNLEFRSKIYQIIQEANNKENKQPPTVQELLDDKDRLVTEISNDLEDCALQFSPNLSPEQYKAQYNPQIIENAFLEDPYVYSHYLAAIKNREYYVFFEEIAILASLAQIEITVYYNDGRSIIFKPNQELVERYPSDSSIWGTRSKVVISHKNMHFSHVNSDDDKESTAKLTKPNIQYDSVTFSTKEKSDSIKLSSDKISNNTILRKTHIPLVQPKKSIDDNKNVLTINSQSHSQLKDSNRTKAIIKSNKGSTEGKIYEKLSLALLAEQGYKKYRDFAIGREVNISNDSKFDDIVFRYTNEEHDKNLILIQIKYKQKDDPIDSKILSTEASLAKIKGGLSRDFNLQKYFISYLIAKRNLKTIKSNELKDGKIKYVVIFTNVGLDINELEKQGFALKEASNDVRELFNLDKLPLEAQQSNHYHQIEQIDTKLHKILAYSADLHILAKELAQYTIRQPHNNKMMKIGEGGVIDHYHIVLAKQVIHKFYSAEQGKWKGKFKEDFIENDDISGPAQELRDAIFAAIKELDESKNTTNDDELKEILRKGQWALSKNFGNTKKQVVVSQLEPWEVVQEQDITDFFSDLVFVVNQPKVEELYSLLDNSAHNTVLDNTVLRQVLDQIEKIGSKFRERIDNELGISQKASYKEKWISSSNISAFVQEQKQQTMVSFIGTAMTLIYENEVMQYCQFKNLGELTCRLDNFLQNNNQKILCVNTPNTLFSSIKVLQHLYTKENYKAENRISVNSQRLKNAKNRYVVTEIFKLERNNLLTLECEDVIQDQYMQELYDALSNIITNNSKKIILIAKPNNSLVHKFANKYIDQYSDIADTVSFIDLEDTSQNQILDTPVTFQGNEIILNKLINANTVALNNLIDIETLVQLIKNEEIKIGSDEIGVSDLAGSYTKLYQDVNVKRLISNLNQDTIFIISGIQDTNINNFISKLRAYGELPVNIHDQISVFAPDTNNKTQILLDDNKFQEENFNSLCRIHEDKKIYWITMQDESDNVSPFILQQMYNPDFYVNRQFNHFKKVIIKTKIYEKLAKKCGDIFLFTGVDNQDDLLNIFPEDQRTLIQQNMNGDHSSVVIEAKINEQLKFNQLSAQNKPIHWLNIEKNNDNTQIVWIKSSGTLDNLRKYIDKKSIQQTVDQEFINYIKDTQVVIIADDPGMGKTTSLTKLCTLQYDLEIEKKSVSQSHWVIKINLKDYISTIGSIKSSNFTLDDIINLCSKTNSDLNTTFAKNTLSFALKNTSFIKSILIQFDGFDEILDQNIRDKIIELLKYIKCDPNIQNVSFWITTRLHYEHTLENALSTFATKFEPLDDPQKKEFIYKFLKDRLYLTLSKKQFDNTFGDNADKLHDKTSPIAIYAEAFLIKMKDIFQGDTAKFIGTPLQLYLMLEGSIKDFKEWIENKPNSNQSLNFDYLGDNMLLVYKKFINYKYNIYLEKTNVTAYLLQKRLKITFDQDHQHFAESLIFNSERKKPWEDFKNIVLSVGIIKSHDSYIEFIHPTFREYFAAQVFMNWIEESIDKLSNDNKQEYLLKEIFIKSDYQLIRCFINLQLKETHIQDKILKRYGEIITLKDDNDLIIEIFNNCIEEYNKQIMQFVSNSIASVDQQILYQLYYEYAYSVEDDKTKSTILYFYCNRDGMIPTKIAHIPDKLYDTSIKMLLDLIKENLYPEQMYKLLSKQVNEQGYTVLHVILQAHRENLEDVITEGSEIICMASQNLIEHIPFFYVPCPLCRSEADILILNTASETLLQDHMYDFLTKQDNEQGYTALHMVALLNNDLISKLRFESIIESLSKENIRFKHFLATQNDYDKAHDYYVQRAELLLKIAKAKLSPNQMYEFLSKKDKRGQTALNISLKLSTLDPLDDHHYKDNDIEEYEELYTSVMSEYNSYDMVKLLLNAQKVLSPNQMDELLSQKDRIVLDEFIKECHLDMSS